MVGPKFNCSGPFRNIVFQFLLTVHGSLSQFFPASVTRPPPRNLRSTYGLNVSEKRFEAALPYNVCQCASPTELFCERLEHVTSKFSCEPDVYWHNTVINANCLKGQSSQALHWVNLMITNGCKSSIATISSVIDAFCMGW
ncbi:Pentatricopeptide repeat-containing protein, chloroplastic, partial [Cucurbita argyrosperma subsp. argyrosperma]